jgi:hypothetical protein
MLKKPECSTERVRKFRAKQKKLQPHASKHGGKRPGAGRPRGSKSTTGHKEEFIRLIQNNR